MTGALLIRQALEARVAPDEYGALIAKFTGAERTVARLLAQGQGNRDIAQELGRSEHTIKAQVASILGKLKVANRGRAAAILLLRLNQL